MATLLMTGCFGSDAQRSTSPTSTPSAPASASTGEQSVGDRPELTNVYQVGPKVDLLGMIDPERDAIRGDFRFDGSDLVFSGPRSTQLNFDVDLPEQYELMMTVARTQGSESLNLGIQIGSATTAVVIEGWGRKISALNLVDGQLGEDNITSTQFPVLDGSSARKIRVIVRRQSVLVDVDGGVFIDYRGPPSRLSFDDRFYQRPDRDQLMIGSWESGFRVSSLTLTPLGDEPVRYAATRPEDASTNTEDTSTNTEDASTNAEDAATDFNRGAGDTRPDASIATNMRDAATSQSASETPVQSATEPSEISQANATDNDTDDESNGVESTPVRWSAETDRSPHWKSGVAEQLNVLMGRGWAMVPEGRSHFVAVGEIADDSVKITLYDLREGKSVGSVLRLDQPTERGAYQLSDSGEHLLSYVGVAGSRRVEVHSFVSGDLAYASESPDLRPWRHARDYLSARQGLIQFRGSDNDLRISRIDLKTGKTTCSWEPGYGMRYLEAYAVTPGGRYLIANTRQQLHVYDLVSTKTVGMLSLPETMDDVLAFAFSPDAAELAVLGSHLDRASEIFWCIDWDSGQPTLETDVAEPLNSLSNNYRLGPALEWFPDAELLLYYGGDVLDRKTGRFFYRIPNNVHWQMPRRAVSNGMILAMMPGENPDNREYRTFKIGNQLVEALKVIRGGGIAKDVGLPPLTLTDSTGALRLALSDNNGTVSLDAEPRSEFPAPAVQLPLRLLRSRDANTKLRRIQFAAADTAIAVAHFHFDPERGGESTQSVVRYDLRRGKATGSVQMRSDLHFVDVSPDGSRAILGLANKVGAYSRVDVIDLKTRQHVAGWRPYHDEPFKKDVAATGQPAAINPKNATWIRLVDNDHALTINPEGKLVCWRLPDCEAIYSCEGFKAPYALDARRRMLAGSDGTQLHLLDVRNGKWAGFLTAKQPPQKILRVAFEPGGKEVVAVVGYRGRRDIVFWELGTGRLSEQFELEFGTVSPPWTVYDHPSSRQIGITFKRDGYLMLDDLYLIDRGAGTVPWRYNLQMAKNVVGEPDAREWYAQYQITNDNGQVFDWILNAAPLPSDEVLSLMRQAAPQPGERPVGLSTLKLDGEQASLE